MRLYGRNNEVAIILSDGRQLTLATTISEMAYFSDKYGTAFSWTASLDLGADVNVIWLRNDSLVQQLVVNKLFVSASAAATVEIWTGTGNTVGGTVVTPTILNPKFNNTAPSTCRHTNTNVDAGAGMSILSTHQLGVAAEKTIDYDDALRLTLNTEIAVNVITDIALTSVTILGYFRPVEDITG